MREALDHWDFVIAAYVIGLGALAVLCVWAYRSMAAAEKRREEVKRR